MNKITSINGTLVAPLNKLNEHVENRTAHVTEKERAAWNAQTTVKAKGILIATQEDLDEHAGNSTIHLTEEERTTWNNKADVSALSSKVDTSAFNAHENDTVAHVTDAERQRWNATSELDESGNMTLAGGLTARGASNLNGGATVPMPSALAANTVLNWSGLIGLSALDIAFRAKFVQPTGELKSGVGTITDTTGGKEFSVAKGNVGSFLASYSIVAATFPEDAYGGVCGFCLPLLLNLGKGSKIKLSTPVRGAFAQTYNPDDFDVYSVNCPAFFDLTLERLADNTYAVRTRAHALNRKTNTRELVTTTASLPIGKIKALWWVQPSAYSAECGIYILENSNIYKVSESNSLETYEYSGIRSLIIDAQSSENDRVSLCLADADVYKLYATPGIKQMLDALAINKIGSVVVEPIQL